MVEEVHEVDGATFAVANAFGWKCVPLLVGQGMMNSKREEIIRLIAE